MLGMEVENSGLVDVVPLTDSSFILSPMTDPYVWYINANIWGILMVNGKPFVYRTWILWVSLHLTISHYISMVGFKTLPQFLVGKIAISGPTHIPLKKRGPPTVPHPTANECPYQIAETTSHDV